MTEIPEHPRERAAEARKRGARATTPAAMMIAQAQADQQAVREALTPQPDSSISSPGGLYQLNISDPEGNLLFRTTGETVQEVTRMAKIFADL